MTEYHFGDILAVKRTENGNMDKQITIYHGSETDSVHHLRPWGRLPVTGNLPPVRLVCTVLYRHFVFPFLSLLFCCNGLRLFADFQHFIMPLLLIMGSAGFMFGTGGSALISKTIGEGKQKEAAGVF